MLRLLVSYFPAGFFSPSPLGCVLQNLPLQLLVARLSTWPPLNPCGGLCCDIQLRGLGGGGGGQSLPRQGHCPLGHVVCLCVSSLTPLPPLSVLLFCLNGADSLLLGGLLSSFQAFGFGVYCFVLFFPPRPAETDTVVGSQSVACVEGVLGVAQLWAALPSDPAFSLQKSLQTWE